MTDDDPLADAADGDTVTHTEAKEMSLWSGAPRAWLGEDRRVDDIRASNIRIEGDSGNERIAYEIEADVTKVDPKVKPTYHRRETWERRRGNSPSSDSRVLAALSRHSNVISGAAATLIAGYVGVNVAQDVLASAGDPAIQPPTMGVLIPLLLGVVAVISVLQYYATNRARGV